MPNLVNWLSQFFSHPISTLEQAFPHFSQPSHYSIALTIAADLPRSKSQLIAENALLHQQLLHWHRQGFRLFWKFKSRKRSGRPKLSTDTINLIQQMARANLRWGAERIRGELLKLDIKVATATIQKYMHLARPPRAPSLNWSVFLNNHTKDVWVTQQLREATPYGQPPAFFDSRS